MPVSSQAAISSGLWVTRGRGDPRPIIHLDTREQAIVASFRFEDGCLAFLDVEPVLAKRIDDVWLMRDEYDVRAAVGRPAQHAPQCFRPPVVLVWRDHEASFGQIGRRLDILKTRQHCILVCAIKLARVDPPDRNTCCANRVAKGPGEFLALVIEVALLGYVGEMERIYIGLVAKRRAVPNKYDVSARAQLLREPSDISDRNPWLDCSERFPRRQVSADQPQSPG